MRFTTEPTGGMPATRCADLATVSKPLADLEEESFVALFDGHHRLVGTRCRTCGRLVLGRRSVCSTCVSTDIAEVPLADSGRVYSYTVIHVGYDEPRAMGYVDLNDGVRVLADLRAVAVPLSVDVQVVLEADADNWWFATVSAGQVHRATPHV